MVEPATSVTAHNSVSPSVPVGASVEVEHRAMMQIQTNHAAKWLGIGYNFALTQNGNIYECRGWGRVGAHAGTVEGNATSIGIVFLIDGRREAPTAAAMEAFDMLRKSGVEGVHLTRDHALKFHRDWKDTECPGDLVVAALRKGPAVRMLRRGMRGPDVHDLQARLVALGYMTIAEMATGPGIFGPATNRAVRSYQWAKGLAVDGIAGPKTMRALLP
jgi:hypothetical protein